MPRIAILGAGLAAIAIVGGWVVQPADVIVHPPARPAGLDAHESNGAVSLLGQFRTSIASWLWLRTDLYLHNGVEMRPLTEQEIRQGQRGVGSSDNDDGKLMDDDIIVTIIPQQEKDFRGILGDIERATSAYKDMSHHAHNDPQSALPLFRLMTWLDPQFLPGWITGANVIARNEQSLGHAIRFLLEGYAQNPQSPALPGEIGYLIASTRRDFDSALPYFEQARKLGVSRPKELTEDELESWRTTYRWLGLIYRDKGELVRMYSVLREGQSVFPDDLVIDRLLNTAPAPLNLKSQNTWEQNHLKAKGLSTSRP